MAKTAVKKTVDKAEFVNSIQQMGADYMLPENLSALHQMAMNVPTEQLQKIAGGETLKFEKDNTYILVVTGIRKDALPSKNANTPDARIDAIEVTNLETGEENINADAVFVRNISYMVANGKMTLPCVVKVFCKGERTSKVGTYADIDVWRY